MRKGLKGEKKDEWLEKIEKEGCRCENKNKWTDRKRCGWRDRKRERDTERWRFSWELAYFFNECIRTQSCVTFMLWNEKRLAKIGTLQIGGSDFQAHRAQSVASADVYHRHRMKTHFALPGCLPGNGKIDHTYVTIEHKAKIMQQQHQTVLK